MDIDGRLYPVRNSEEIGAAEIVHALPMLSPKPNSISKEIPTSETLPSQQSIHALNLIHRNHIAAIRAVEHSIVENT